MLFCLIIITLAACTDTSTSAVEHIQIHEARLLADFDGTAFSDWDTVYAQNQGGQSNTYAVSKKPLLSAWNFLALNASPIQADDTQIVTVRLNAFAEKKMQEFSRVRSNLKVPLGLRSGKRWVNFFPLLNPVTDRMTLRGLYESEVSSLQSYIDNR
tara:strand:+ start:76 stop:543 length:468 start_codon:yes stop_codon:yes gene_type:complete